MDPEERAILRELMRNRAGRRLHPRDALLQYNARNAPEDLPAQEMQPGNIQELMNEIAQTQDPRARALLEAELRRLRDNAQNLMGPMAPPQFPGHLQNTFPPAIFNPQDPTHQMMRPFPGGPARRRM